MPVGVPAKKAAKKTARKGAKKAVKKAAGSGSKKAAKATSAPAKEADSGATKKNEAPTRAVKKTSGQADQAARSKAPGNKPVGSSGPSRGSGEGRGSSGARKDRHDEPARLVPDTSVVVDGRFTRLVEEEFHGAEVLVPEAVVAELESLANRGIDAGYNGLDELIALQTLERKGHISMLFVGHRPTADEVELARGGEIDAIIRECAEDEDALLVTGDKIQAQVAEAMGLPYRYLRSADEGQSIEELGVLSYFSEGMMSVHLKQDVAPHGKRGTPGEREYFEIDPRKLSKREINELAREVIEVARRDDRSFVEIERTGATVVQLRDMRIAISRPPFSDAIEITVVRPVTHLDLEDYDLPPEVESRLTDHSRGVFVSGPPGSGKSTFAQAVAEFLHRRGTVVKTMESPRDLQLIDEITQYAPLERDIELTGDFLLLVRPDFVVYDEVRKTRDFEVFADMRLAGVGLIGVTHANRAIDAVQRLIGRVELGMIPQVVDTVVHIVGGEIQQILEMDFTVRVPAGMTEADLARPVIRVRDFQSKEEMFEIYTYGEQVVVMPIQAVEGGGKKESGMSKLAEKGLVDMLRRRIQGRFVVDMAGPDRATLYVEDWEVPKIIGRGGTNVQRLQERAGVKLDVRSFAERDEKLADVEHEQRPKRKERYDGPAKLTRKSVDEEALEEIHPGREEFLHPYVRILKKQVILTVEPEYAGAEVEVLIEGQPVTQGNLSTRGEMRLKKGSPEGHAIVAAHKHGADLTVRVIQ